MIETEKIILGELIHASEDDRFEAISQLDAEGLFRNQEHKEIFHSISKLVIKGLKIDQVSLYQDLHSKVDPKIISEISFLGTNNNNLFSHIQTLKFLKYKRDVEKIAKNSLKEIRDAKDAEDIEELKSKLISELSGIGFEDKSEFVDLDEQNQLLMKQIQSDRKIEGYSWGLSDLDKWTSGLVKPRVYVVGGLKKAGKSRFIIFLMKNLHEQNIPTAFLSLEMPSYEVNKLLRACFCGIDDVRLRSSSYLSKEELKSLSSVKIDNTVLRVECRAGLELKQILSRIRKYTKMGFKVIIIDYIQRIDHDRNKQAQELENISFKIADSARVNNVVIIILSQLNALGEKQVPNMGHLKGSGAIGEAADTIILFDNLYRRNKKNIKNKIDLYIEQRYGDSGKLSIQADLGSCTFRNFASKKTSELSLKF
jgi:replicative DNA helicase